jgi:hypothetical protein
MGIRYSGLKTQPVATLFQWPLDASTPSRCQHENPRRGNIGGRLSAKALAVEYVSRIAVPLVRIHVTGR